jgi:hypothetical protein
MFWILFNAYSICGQRHKAEQVLGLMCKPGTKFLSIASIIDAMNFKKQSADYCDGIEVSSPFVSPS